MSFSVMNKVTGRFLSGTSSNQAVRDPSGLVDLKYAATYGSLAGAKAAMRSWLDIYNSQHIDFRQIDTHPWLADRFSAEEIAERAAMFVQPEDMVIVEVELVLGNIVSG
jgi:hypothetical protein